MLIRLDSCLLVLLSCEESPTDAFNPPPAPAADTPDSQDRHHPARHEAKEFLFEMLKKGPMLSKDILKSASEVGICKNTLRTAKEEMGVDVVRKHDADKGSWYWRLPGSNGKDSNPDKIP